MNVLFAGGNGYYPEFHGGVQSSTHHLVEQLRSRGHEASVLASLFGDGIFGMMARIKMKVFRQRAAIDHFPGYPVVRAWFPWEAVPFAVSRLKPDVAVVQCHKSVPLGKALEQANVPIVVYLRNVEFHELAGDLSELKSAHYIANSDFTARAYRDRFGIQSTVIPPTIDPERYRTPTSKEYVTFINPYKEKGFELAVRIAERCPEIPFLFVESWKLDGDHRAAVEQTIAPLKNVTLQSRADDMKTVYGRTRSCWRRANGKRPGGGSRPRRSAAAYRWSARAAAACPKRSAKAASCSTTKRRSTTGSRPSGSYGTTPITSTACRRRPSTIRGGPSSIQSISSRCSSTSCNAPPPGPGLRSTPSLANAPQSRHIARPRSIGMQHEDRLCRW